MKTILIPVSLRETTDALVARAAPVAATFGSTVWLLHVYRTGNFLPSHRLPPELKAERDEEFGKIHRTLDRYAEIFSNHGLTVHPYVLPAAEPADLILEQADAVKADLLVMGSHGRGALMEALLGDVTHTVLRKAPCPVLVIPLALLLPDAGAKP